MERNTFADDQFGQIHDKLMAFATSLDEKEIVFAELLELALVSMRDDGTPKDEDVRGYSSVRATRQEQLRHRRQSMSTAFRAFDQKSGQMFNMLRSVLKSIHESQHTTVGKPSRSRM